MLAPFISTELQPSRVACVLIVALMISALAALVSASLGALYLSVGAAVVIGWSIDQMRIVGLRLGPRAVRGVLIRGDDSIRVLYADGRIVDGRLERGSAVSAHLTTIVWTPRRRSISKAILILPDMLPADAFRQLRVVMRYGRSEEAQGLPESQA